MLTFHLLSLSWHKESNKENPRADDGTSAAADHSQRLPLCGSALAYFLSRFVILHNRSCLIFWLVNSVRFIQGLPLRAQVNNMLIMICISKNIVLYLHVNYL